MAAPGCLGCVPAGTLPGLLGRCSSASGSVEPATPGPVTAATSTTTDESACMPRATPSRPPPATCATTAPPTDSTGRCTPTTTPGGMSPGSSGSPAAMSPVGVGTDEHASAAPSALPVVRQPGPDQRPG